MSISWWWLAAGALALVGAILWRILGARSRTRDLVLDEIKRSLRGSVVESLPGRGPQLRGRIGKLEITVDLHEDESRPKQSPMWRVLAVGPVRLDHSIEAKVAGWEGWIDPWLQLGEVSAVPAGVGPAFTLHAERAAPLDHPIVTALRRQGPSLGPGALHARSDLMRTEVKFHVNAQLNKPLFAYMQAMVEISERSGTRPSAPSAPHQRRLRDLRPVPRSPQ